MPHHQVLKSHVQHGISRSSDFGIAFFNNPLIVLIIALVVFKIGIFAYRNHRFKKTTYFQITKNPYLSLDRGQRGEYLIYKELRHYENRGGKFLFNLYIPKTDERANVWRGVGNTTEIDVLLICSKGLFVFESKNFSGWIFGNEAHQNWTQTLPRGRRSSHKERFYNPIMQNASHIKYLKRIIGETLTMHSIVVFSNKCTLKDVTVNSKNVRVVYRHAVAPVVEGLFNQASTSHLTETEISNIYNQLFPYTQVGDEVRTRHTLYARVHSGDNS